MSLLKLFLSILVTLLFYWGMVTAFHLLNLPSDLAVVGGLCLLFLIAAGGFFVFKKVWRL